MTSFSVVSLIAIVPDSECRMPTLMVSSARAVEDRAAKDTAAAAASAVVRSQRPTVGRGLEMRDIV